MKKSFFLLLAFTAVAFADTTAVISWSHPTTYIDGRVLPIGDIKSTTIKWGRTATGPFDLGTVTVNGNATTVTIPNLSCGNYHFVAYTTVTTNEQSKQSDAVLKATGVSCNTPNPPTAVTVQ